MKKKNNYETLTDFERHDVITDDGAHHINIDDFDQTGATYRVAFGSRVGGKTYGYKIKTLQAMLHDKQVMYTRRYDADIDPAIISCLWDDAVADGLVKKYAEQKFTGYDYFDVVYEKKHFHLRGIKTRHDDENGDELEYKKLYDLSPVTSMSNWVRYKSTPYPNCDDIVFDEFLTSERKLTDEFKRLLNMASTVFRKRPDCHVYLFGNTVDRDCEILEQMGIDIRTIPQGMSVKEFKEINPESKNYITNRIAVFYYGSAGQTAASRSYFVFENKSDAMIVNGEWETAQYPKIDYDLIARRSDIYPNAFVFVKGCMSLYLYEFDDLIYVSDKRIKNRDVHYNTITDAPTNISREHYSYRFAPVVDILKQIQTANDRGELFFSNDLTGEDFNNKIMPVTALKG